MAALDRNTGLPVTGYPREQSFNQRTAQVTGPRTDVGQSNTIERANQSVASAQSAVNTTPTALAALDTLIGQLLGAPGTEQATLPELVLVQRQGRAGAPIHYADGLGSEYYEDPVTKKRYSKIDGWIENDRRQKENKKIQVQEATKPKDTEPKYVGTQEQVRQQEQRQEEIVRNRGRQDSDYSKQAAFADAQALVDKSIADALEKALPQITAGLEGAGTSRSTTAALLTQRAAERGAVEGAALGAQQATTYGGIQAALANTLELLTRSDPNSPTALLLQAILGSKGLVSEQVGSQSTSGTVQKSTDTTQNVGPQDTLQNTFKQILDPLASLGAPSALRTQANAAAQAPTITTPSAIVRHNTPAYDNRSIQIFSNTEDALFNEDY